jgi:hypothetical protein
MGVEGVRMGAVGVEATEADPVEAVPASWRYFDNDSPGSTSGLALDEGLDGRLDVS